MYRIQEEVVIRVLVLVLIRELVVQVYIVVRQLVQYINIEIVLLVGTQVYSLYYVFI